MKKYFIKSLMISVLFLVITINNSCAQFSKPGPQVETFYSVIDDSEQPYGLYLPMDFNPEKTYPLVIMLHGSGSNHRLALRRVFGKYNLPGENDVEASRYFPSWDNVEYIVATPYARGSMGYKGIAEEDVMRVIEECRKNFKIDDNRVYLTGLSMGGWGTLTFGLTHPDLFAAIAPVCPPLHDEDFDLLGNALNMQVAIYQGAADVVVNVQGVRYIAQELQNLGTPVEYYEYPDVNHNVWEYSYKNQNIFKWFDNIVRNPYPDRVRYTTRWYKHNSAYWVLIDKLTPGTLASIDAQFKGENNLQIATTGIDAFTLRLKGHSKLSGQKPLTATINGQIVQSSPKNNHSFYLKNGKWTAEKYLPPFKSKQPGLEGPLAAAINDRHIYVYGTSGNPTAEELKKRIEIATQAADFGAADIHPRVIADKNIRPSDYESSNLILFGTKETNLVIEKFSNQLPVQLNADSTGYGLLYCFPVNGHYVVINSGIPFWTTNRPVPKALSALDFAPVKPSTTAVRIANSYQPVVSGAGALIGFKDFLLFKGVKENIISDGYFDQNWKFPAETAVKLEASGVVTLSEK